MTSLYHAVPACHTSLGDDSHDHNGGIGPDVEQQYSQEAERGQDDVENGAKVQEATDTPDNAVQENQKASALQTLDLVSPTTG